MTSNDPVAARVPTWALGALLAAVACATPSPTLQERASDPGPAFIPPLLANVAAGGGAKPRSLPCPAHVPEAINPPPDTTIDGAWPASGVQIYACASAKAGDAPSWTLEGPHAQLTSGDHLAAIHFAGPSWQAIDGSQVKGEKLAGADAPVATAVPWLLLSATPTGNAAGTFAQITHVQRLDTVGGKAPATGCDASHVGAKVLVPYRANYFFYRKTNAGETARQCRSEAAKPHKG